jgi:hypothetical protein
VATNDELIRFRVPAEQKRLLEDAAKRSGQSLSDWARGHLLAKADGRVPYQVPNNPPPELPPDTRRFAQSAPAKTKTTEQDVRERIRLQELRKSAPKADACPAYHMRGVRCKLCKSVG